MVCWRKEEQTLHRRLKKKKGGGKVYKMNLSLSLLDHLKITTKKCATFGLELCSFTFVFAKRILFF